MGLCLQLATPEEAATDSIFPKAERMLQDKRTQRAVRFVTGEWPDKRNRFRSLLDWFTCRTLPELLKPCRAFYADKGPKLDEVYTAEQIRATETFLVNSLKLCLHMAVNEQPGSWEIFQQDLTKGDR
jgi:hypothetical protein